MKAAVLALAALLAGAPSAAGAADAGRDFDAFIERFRADLRARDAAAIADLTRLPFLYAASTGPPSCRSCSHCSMHA